MSNVKAYLEDIVRDGLHDIAEALKGSGPSGDVQASHVIYDNTESGLTSNRVQGAIDELSTKVDTNTSGISDLGDDVSDLTTRVGTAEGDITALDGRLDTAEGDITSLDGRLDTAEGDITALETWKDNLDARDISYGSGTVEDALDNLPVKIYKVTGTTGAVNVATILQTPSGATPGKLVVIGFNVKASNGYWYSNVTSYVEVQIVTSSTIRVTALDGGYASQPIVVLVAEYT